MFTRRCLGDVALESRQQRLGRVSRLFLAPGLLPKERSLSGMTWAVAVGTDHNYCNDIMPVMAAPRSMTIQIKFVVSRQLVAVHTHILTCPGCLSCKLATPALLKEVHNFKLVY